MSEQPSLSVRSRRTVSVLLTVLCLVIAAAQIVIVATTYEYANRSVSSREGAVPAEDPAELDRLKSGLMAADPGRRVESAVALLQRGMIEGGSVLLEAASDPDVGARRVAVAEFGRVARPMAEAVGVVLDWPVPADTPPATEHIRLAKAFWERWATPRLLLDVQARLSGADSRWERVEQATFLRNWLRWVSESDRDEQ
ncbi:MAG TPA: hypothetical protein PLL20_13825 [Phycisphaerae bacterium]|nr:hypothetical protein [Phycisphaerae bacterium]HRR83729.1 hypothetical protein [Phycisphaerae bacterium]